MSTYVTGGVDGILIPENLQSEGQTVYFKKDISHNFNRNESRPCFKAGFYEVEKIIIQVIAKSHSNTHIWLVKKNDNEYNKYINFVN